MNISKSDGIVENQPNYWKFAMRFIAMIIMMLFMAVYPVNESVAKPTEVAAALNSGNAAYKLKKFDDAAFYYRKAHELGNVQATYNLGVLYRQGKGVKRDYGEAVRLYKIAVSKNYKSAFYSLATLYENGSGVAQDYHEAARLYKLAVDHNQLKAMNRLGAMYKKGNGVERDYAQAVKLFKMAADKGNLDGVYNLAHMHHAGKGVKQDFKEAARLFEILATKKNKNSMYLLATMYDTGQGVTRSPKKAAGLVFELIELGHNFTRKEIIANWKNWNKKTRKELQRLMKINSHYNGPVTGNFGPSTIDALKHMGNG